MNVYRSLDEGILSIENDNIVFTNSIAEDIIMNIDFKTNFVLSFDQAKQKIFDEKVFVIHKLNEGIQ